MPQLSVKEVEYGPWGKCLELSNGKVEAVATLELGPRIIRYSVAGGPNMFMEDPDGAIRDEGGQYAVFGEREWRLYGGHRFWVSPEVKPQTYYPDHRPVQWKQEGETVILSPPPEIWNNLQKQLELTMNPADGSLRVAHRLTNTGAWPIEAAPWALSVMARGGRAIIPHASRETGLLPNRVVVLWPYSRMNDKRVSWGEKLVQISQGPGHSPFKFGSNNESGWSAYHNDGHLFIKYHIHDNEAVYPDMGVSLECYVCEQFLELETLGALETIEPAQSAVHEEIWQLIEGVSLPDEEQAAMEVLNRYISNHCATKF